MSDHHATDSWERWVGSTTPPIQRIKRRARVDTRGGRPWITYRDEINGTAVIVEMPNNAPHPVLRRGPPRRLLAPPRRPPRRRRDAQALAARLHRCGCPCHNDPFRAGHLF